MLDSSWIVLIKLFSSYHSHMRRHARIKLKYIHNIHGRVMFEFIEAVNVTDPLSILPSFYSTKKRKEG